MTSTTTEQPRADAERPVIEQRGLYFEELEEGVLYRHAPGKTIDDAENSLFTTMTMNPASIHLDEAASSQTEFGRRLVNSMLTLSTLVGLSVAQMTQKTTVANLGFTEIAFPKPVFGGDTLYAETVVCEKRESRSRPNSGIVVFEHTARNQRGEVVASARRSALMLRRPDAS
jgi:acyl dehydratase